MVKAAVAIGLLVTVLVSASPQRQRGGLLPPTLPGNSSAPTEGLPSDRPAGLPGGRRGSTGGLPSGPPGSTGGLPSSPPGSTGGLPSGPPGSTGDLPSGPPGSTGGLPSGPLGSTGGLPSGPPGSTGGRRPSDSSQCPADDKACKCRILMEPSEKPAGMEATIKTIMDTCASQTGFTLPSKPEKPANRKDGRFNPDALAASLSNEMKDCIGKAIMKNMNMLDANGQMNQTALVDFFTKSLTANSAKVQGVTSTQIQTIINGVVTCINTASVAPLQAVSFQECMNTTCSQAV